jgi:hypothetical protein
MFEKVGKNGPQIENEWPKVENLPTFAILLCQDDKGKVKCNLCDKELGDERTLLNHVENTHILTMESRERKYQCKVRRNTIALAI